MEEVKINIEMLYDMESDEWVPPVEPPRGETWRCDKGYCDAPCFRNARYTAPLDENATVVL